MQFKSFFPASTTGEKLAEVVFRILDEDNGGTIGFPEIQKVTKILICEDKVEPNKRLTTFYDYNIDINMS